MAHILVVGPDREFLALLRFACESAGHVVSVAESLPSALAVRQRVNPELTIIDSTRPEGHGCALTRPLRAASARPIMMLTARRSDAQQIACFDAGADDCVSLPCNMTVLLRHVQVHLRRATHRRPDIIVADLGGSCINFETNELTGAHGCIGLTPTEGRILRHLLTAQGQPLTSRTIATRLWGPHAAAGSALKSHIYHLRRKLRATGGDSASVEMVAGGGYRLTRPA